MQPNISAPFPLWGRISDVLPVVLPANQVALHLHQFNEVRSASGGNHGIINCDCKPEFPAFSLICGAVFRRRHSGSALLFWLDDGQTVLHTQLIRCHPYPLNIVLVGVVFPSILGADGVDDQVGMEVVTVRMGADQNLKSGELLRQLQGDFVGGFRSQFLLRGEGLYHMVVHPSPGLFVETLCVHKLPVSGTCYTVNPRYQMPHGCFIPGFLLPFAVLHGAI